MNNTVLAGGTSPFITSRIAAMVPASVFDAVNGIDPRFHPLHVPPKAPDNASQRAAAIQAAYVILADAYPAQSAALTTQRNASLGTLALTENAKYLRRDRLGTNRRRRHLGLAPHRRQRATACSLLKASLALSEPPPSATGVPLLRLMRQEPVLS
jgi:hypothetical protein